MERKTATRKLADYVRVARDPGTILRSTTNRVTSACSQLYGQVVPDYTDGPFHPLSYLGVCRAQS